MFLLNLAIHVSSFHTFTHLAVGRKCVHISSCISLTVAILILKTSKLECLLNKHIVMWRKLVLSIIDQKKNTYRSSS